LWQSGSIPWDHSVIPTKAEIPSRREGIQQILDPGFGRDDDAQAHQVVCANTSPLFSHWVEGLSGII
jgi:hypothetical protein